VYFTFRFLEQTIGKGLYYFNPMFDRTWDFFILGK
jgi:hypothetical protein